MTNLQDIFPCEKVLLVKELDPGYEDHASDVWYVKTDKREVIVRTSGIEDAACTGPFFKGCNILFGIDPTNVFAMEGVSDTLARLDAFTYPKVLGKHKSDREYVVVELLRGTTLHAFNGLPDDELIKLGYNLAKIHSHKLHYWGNPAGTFKIDMEQVNSHIIRSMGEIVNLFYLDDHKIVSYLPQMERILRDLPAPKYTSYVLVDMDPTQFLADNGRITGLVDTEAYVIAPREFDFIALEYVLDEKSAQLISQGYKSILPLPDISAVRTVYRYLYRLIEVQSADDIDDWLAQPALF